MANQDSENKHLSVDMLNYEKHYDNFNIDFIRYFSNLSFLINLFVSSGITLLWLVVGWEKFSGITLRNIAWIDIIGAFFFLYIITLVVKFAGNSFKESFRLASRRLLFSFATMNIAIAIIVSATRRVMATDPFGKTVLVFFISWIFCAITAVVLDMVIPATIGRKKK